MKHIVNFQNGVCEEFYANTCFLSAGKKIIITCDDFYAPYNEMLDAYELDDTDNECVVLSAEEYEFDSVSEVEYEGWWVDITRKDGVEVSFFRPYNSYEFREMSQDDIKERNGSIY
jgi:hypothetical protein